MAAPDKTCPDCAETVKGEAAVCRYCGYRFRALADSPPGASAAPAAPAPVLGEHPQGTTVLVLGILGLVLCQVLAPVAWVRGTRVLREIDEAGQPVSNRGTVAAGRMMGIVGTVLLGLGALITAATLLLVLVTGEGSEDATAVEVPAPSLSAPCGWTTSLPSAVPVEGGDGDTVEIEVDGQVLSTRFERDELYGVHVSVLTSDEVTDVDAGTIVLNEPTGDGRFETTFEMIDTSPDGADLEIPCGATVEIVASSI